MAGTWSFIGRNIGMATYGKEFGNAHPDSPDFPNIVAMAEKDFGGPIFVLRVKFRNDWIMNIADPKSAFTFVGDGAGWRSAVVADGAFLPINHTIEGLAICNADCPVLRCPVTKNGETQGLALLHLGYENLAPIDGSSIIETWRDWLVEHNYDPPQLPFIGLGIGACCYGRDPGVVLQRYKGQVAHLTGRAYRGPRTGQPSVNLMSVAMAELSRCFPNHHKDTPADIDRRCTACATDPSGQRLFWSNVYDGSDPDPLRAKGRNLTVFGWRP